jgi:hypothetical protein
MSLWCIHTYPDGIGKHHLAPEEIRSGEYVDASWDGGGAPARFNVGPIYTDTADGGERLATVMEIESFLHSGGKTIDLQRAMELSTSANLYPIRVLFTKKGRDSC